MSRYRLSLMMLALTGLFVFTPLMTAANDVNTPFPKEAEQLADTLTEDGSKGVMCPLMDQLPQVARTGKELEQQVVGISLEPSVGDFFTGLKNIWTHEAFKGCRIQATGHYLKAGWFYLTA